MEPPTKKTEDSSCLAMAALIRAGSKNDLVLQPQIQTSKESNALAQIEQFSTSDEDPAASSISIEESGVSPLPESLEEVSEFCAGVVTSACLAMRGGPGEMVPETMLRLPILAQSSSPESVPEEGLAPETMLRLPTGSTFGVVVGVDRGSESANVPGLMDGRTKQCVPPFAHLVDNEVVV